MMVTRLKNDFWRLAGFLILIILLGIALGVLSGVGWYSADEPDAKAVWFIVGFSSFIVLSGVVLATLFALLKTALDIQNLLNK